MTAVADVSEPGFATVEVRQPDDPFSDADDPTVFEAGLFTELGDDQVSLRLRLVGEDDRFELWLGGRTDPDDFEIAGGLPVTLDTMRAIRLFAASAPAFELAAIVALAWRERTSFGLAELRAEFPDERLIAEEFLTEPGKTALHRLRELTRHLLG